MAIVEKDLTALNSTVEITSSEEQTGYIQVQYGAGGAGTLVLEASVNESDYVAVTVTNTVAKVDSADMTAAGIYYALDVGYRKIRLRKSLGAASLPASLGVSYS